MLRNAVVTQRQGGFTLFEMLIVLGMAVGLTMLVMQTLAPWMTFRQNLENEQKLATMRVAMLAAYEQSLETVDAVAGAGLSLKEGANPPAVYLPSTVDALRQCSGMTTTETGPSASILSNLAGVSQEAAGVDGYNQNWCFFASNRLTVERNGVPLLYHVFALVSPGRNGRLEPGTGVNPATGVVTINGDDRGTVVDGRLLQAKLFDDAAVKLAKVAGAYEIYFTSRYLANPSRDVSINYFANNWDSTGLIPSTAGTFMGAGATLASLGLTPDDYTTAYGEIEVGNYDECVSSPTAAHPDICVKSPQTGTSLPYTALLRVKMPGGEYLSRVAVGGY